MTPDSDNLKFLPRTRFLTERKVLFITDCPLDLEVKNGTNYSSQSASMQFRELHKIGIPRNHIHATYLFNFRPPKGNIGSLLYKKGYPASEYRQWPEGKNVHILNYAYNALQVLRDEIQRVKPSLILCSGRWSLYFLTGETTVTETRKSKYGTLLKWRASHLQLNSWWGYKESHILMPILPAASKWQLPDKQHIIQQDLKRCGTLAKLPIEELSKQRAREENYIIAPTYDQVQQTLHELITMADAAPLKLGFDVETRMGHQDCIGIAWSKSEAICIPFTTMAHKHYWSEEEMVEILFILQKLMLHPNVQHLGQNYSYDMQYYMRDFAIKVAPHQDTMVMHHTLFPGLDKSLDFLASLYCSIYRYWKGAGKEGSYKHDEERWIYNCRDSCITLEAAHTLETMYEHAAVSVQKAYHFQQYELLPALVEVMNRGVRVNKKKKQELYETLVAMMQDIQEEIDYILGEHLNLNSPAQLQKVFYTLFKLPVQKNPKTFRPSTDTASVTALKELEPTLAPFFDRILEYRSLKVFSSTFLAAKVDIDGRMRTSYNLCGTDTFRLASRQNAFGSGMNLQNVPAGGTTQLGYELPNVKDLFICDDGMMFFDIDLDSADLRIVVAESGASGLQQMLDEGLKPYVELMKEYYHDPNKSKHSKEYRTFKGLAHGSNYKGTAGGLAKRLGLLVHEVDTIQKWYFGANPEIPAWHKAIEEQVMKRGWIENVFGYRRFFFNKQHPTLLNIAMAWKPQSTVGILINHGLVNIRHNEPEIKVHLQVHDSLAGQFPIGLLNAEERIKKQCSIELPYKKPIIIPVDIVTSDRSWGYCK